MYRVVKTRRKHVWRIINFKQPETFGRPGCERLGRGLRGNLAGGW